MLTNIRGKDGDDKVNPCNKCHHAFEVVGGTIFTLEAAKEMFRVSRAELEKLRLDVCPKCGNDIKHLMLFVIPQGKQSQT